MEAWCSGQDFGVIRIIHGVHAIVPVLAAERSRRKRVLDDVVELAVARVQFDFSVMEKVVCAADAWSDFVAPAELDAGGAGAVGWQIFRVEANACIDREARLTN